MTDGFLQTPATFQFDLADDKIELSLAHSDGNVTLIGYLLNEAAVRLFVEAHNLGKAHAHAMGQLGI